MAGAVRCEGCREGIEPPFPFTMAFQPIVDVGEGRVWGYEALVRGIGGAGAGEVLDRVDEHNRYRFDQSCRVKAIELAGRLMPRASSLKLSINFMPDAVYEPAACIRASLAAAARFDVPITNIVFEFTENQRVNVAHTRSIIAEYRRQGFLTAIDDFGSGFSGLNLLADFDTDLIKLDMDLIRGIDADGRRQKIVAGLTAMAADLDLDVIAEGIETAEEAAFLRGIGINLLQGYFFARPMTEGLPEIDGRARAIAGLDQASPGHP